jgi:hypothetical protein
MVGSAEAVGLSVYKINKIAIRKGKTKGKSRGEKGADRVGGKQGASRHEDYHKFIGA